MGKPLPDEVYINKTETLPRALVSQCAKSGCKRCGGAGWFRFSGGFGQLFLCPCAQEKVRAKVTETKEAVTARRARPVLEVVAEVLERMIADGEIPDAMVCSRSIAAKIREASGDGVTPVSGAAFTIQVAGRELLVYPDPEAPENFSRFFAEREWKQLEKRLKEREAERRRDAQREQDAAAELAQMRADLRSGRL